MSMVDESKELRAERASRSVDLSSYAGSDRGRALLALATSVVPFLGLWVLMYLALSVSYYNVTGRAGSSEWGAGAVVSYRF